MRSFSFLLLLPPLLGWMAGCEKNSGNDKDPDPKPAETSPQTGTATPLVESPEAPPPTDPGTTPPTGETPATPETPANPVENPVVTPDEPVTPVEPEKPLPPTELRIKEAQFWVYERIDGNLSFNTPWDEEEGDGILRDENLAPSYARDCLRIAQETYANLAKLTDFQERIKPILAQGATSDLIFLVVSTDSENDRTALRKLDRDAYFWHWTDTAKKPVLSMNQYEKGSWVWEVIATPKSCIQPVIRDLGRYLDWTSRRQQEKGANP